MRGLLSSSAVIFLLVSLGCKASTPEEIRAPDPGVGQLPTGPPPFEACLPAGIEDTDVVSAERLRPSNVVEKTTVAQKLTELGAHCVNGVLVDASGKEIYFFKMVGCWGNPPADYQEVLSQQDQQLQELRKQYNVVEMTCNPDGTDERSRQ